MMDYNIAEHFEQLVFAFFNANLSNVIDRTDGAKNKGMPDIEIKGKMYIECTIAQKGKGNDGVNWEVPIWEKEDDAAFCCVPDEVVQAWTQFAYQRIANRLKEKQDKFEKNKNSFKNFDKELPRIVALTVDLNELSHDYGYDDLYEDVLRKLLWDNGAGINVRFYLDGTSAELPHKDGVMMQSQNGSDIYSGVFNDVNFNYKDISAILFISPNAVSRAMSSGRIGIKDMFLCINRYANVIISKSDWEQLLKPKVLREFISG